MAISRVYLISCLISAYFHFASPSAAISSFTASLPLKQHLQHRSTLFQNQNTILIIIKIFFPSLNPMV